MQPVDACDEFERFLAARGQRVAALAPRDALAAMVAFYGDVQAEGCDLDRDGDMLLYQWGTYDRGHGPHFELGLTRQLYVHQIEDEHDCEIWQLSLTFLFTPTPLLAAAGKGDRWCHSLDERDDFRGFVFASHAYAVASATPPLRIELDVHRAD